MPSIHLFFCSFLFVFSSTTLADMEQGSVGVATKEPVDQLIRTPEKMASRASFSNVHERTTNNLNVQIPTYNSPEHQKKQLSEGEKQILRRQVTEIERKYPQKGK